MTGARTPEKAPDSPPLDRRSGLSKALSLFSTYSWRGRIGLVSPSTNTTLEPEFWRLAPEGVSIHVARVFQSGPQEPSTYRRMADDIGTAATLLATAEVDVIAFGCTSCTYFVPPEEIRGTMAEKARCPTVLTADAVVDALRALDVRRVALASPRTEFVTQRELKFLADSGFEVVASHSLGLGATEEERRYIGRVPTEALYRLATSVDRPEAEAVFVTCTQLPTLPMIERLETALGKPVITSNQATLWRCLRHIGFKAPIKGYGRLLDAQLAAGA
jgi:arylmalonate decarboxylase